jgi:energy-coupling factor transporter ATP-binding protein EcfA2
MRIERIEIRDFRGFPGSYEFKLGRPGHNLLVYGENGSGKSSLFQALKRFFEADAKTDIRTQGNTFADAPEPVVKLDIAAYDVDGNRDPDSNLFEWSESAHPADTALIQQANKTKGCLDYRTLLETHYVHRDKDRVEIFDLLMRAILPHIENPVSGKSIGEELAGIRTDKRQPMRGWTKNAYQARLDRFNQGFVALIETLNTKANELLRRFFDDVEIHLTVQGKLTLTGVGKGKSLQFPKVFVAATFCDQQTRLDLHHFLNEARLSALAISLYLASLLIVPAARLQLLVLDDLLIGIDMSNRIAVLKTLLEEFKDWQTILLTHDRVWFETVKMNTLDEKIWWYAELFAQPAHDGVPTPLWRGQDEGWTDNLARAKQHLANHDDRAAGVYARAAFEGKLKKYCDKHKVPVPYRANPAEITSDMFWKAVKDKLAADNKLAGVQQQVSDIETYRKVVLNPLSHEHPITLTQAEIQGAITAIEELDKVLMKPVIKREK